jgi:hypothetical protein
MGLELVPEGLSHTIHEAPGGNQTAGSSYKRAGQGVRKQKFTIADLPFSGGSVEVTRTQRNTWRNRFIPSLLDWAGSRKDPFGTNSQMENVVVSIWEQVFPNIMLQGQGLTIVLRVVSLPNTTLH